MHFGFTLDSSVIDLWNIDLLDAYLDLLDTDIFSKHYVCLLDVLQISSRHVFKTPWRRLQRNNFSSSRTFSRRFQDVLRDVFKTPSRRLQDILEDEKLLRWVLKTSWNVLKTNKCLLGNYLPIFMIEHLHCNDHIVNQGDWEHYIAGIELFQNSFLPFSVSNWIKFDPAMRFESL